MTGGPAGSGRRAARGALRIVVVLGAVELVLQLVAWRAWSTEWIGPAGDPIAGRVLVVGGDETWQRGVASRDDAWPAEVGRRLRAAGHDVDVHNGAELARDSRDVLLRLPLQMTLARPALVALCVGGHDFGRRDARVVDERELPGRCAEFVWRLRTRSLLEGLLAGTSAAPPDDALAFLGTWHVADTEFEFAPDGTFVLGGIRATWSRDDGALRVALPGGEPFAVDWTVAGDRLDLRGAFAGGSLSLERGPAVPSDAERARRAFARGDVLAAETTVSPAVVGATADPDAVVAFVEIDAAQGRVAAARRWAAMLPAAPRAPAAIRRAARIRLALGELADGAALVEDALVEHVGDAALVDALRRLPSGDVAARVAARALAAAAAAPPPLRSELEWLAADLLARCGDADDALVAAVRGLAAVPGELDVTRTPAILRAADEAGWERAIGALAPSQREVAASRRAEIAAADAATSAVLDANLTRAIRLVRFFGAEPVLLDPSDDPVASAVRRAVAAAHGVRLASCDPSPAGLAAALEGLVSGR